MAGSRVGRYEVVRPLARGGMSEIYLVKNRGLNSFESLAVLKRLPPHCLVSEPNLVNMFMDEAQLTASLRHPNIAQVFDFGEDEESYFFVMEYVEGLSLAQIQRKCRLGRRRVPLPLALQIVMGVAEALSAAHEAVDANGQSLELVHRDVSPQNVIVTGYGSVKLIDFGIARARLRRERTETGLIKGKIAYMSPEQCRAEPVDRQSDLFSLGLLLYELTTGMRPHGDSRGPEMLFARSEIDCPDPRSLVDNYPDELAAIVNKLLRRSRAERLQSARELHDELSRFAIREGIVLSPFALGAWVDGLNRTLARGSGVWSENGSAVVEVTVKETSPSETSREKTAVICGAARTRSRRPIGTQYDFEILEEHEIESEPKTPNDNSVTPVKDVVATTRRRVLGLIFLGIIVGFVGVFALAAPEQINHVLTSVLEHLRG